MHLSRRTPNSILRKRHNKENKDDTGYLGRRNKLAKRRVSFAPDDELETKHIFKEDSDTHSPHEPPTEHGLGHAQAVAVSTAPDTPVDEHIVGDPLTALPSAEDLSPLSMDLTNNSGLEEPYTGTIAAPGPSCIKGSTIGATVAGSLSLRPHVHQLHHWQAPYGLTDITRNVTQLSTLIEEDVNGYEDEFRAADVSSGHGRETGAAMSLNPSVLGSARSGDLPPDPPMSPNSMSEMQIDCYSEHRADRDNSPLRELWGFAPGEVDTLEMKCCHGVVGDKTYNYLYGEMTLGDLVHSTNSSRMAGHTSKQLGAGSSRLLKAGPVPAANTVRSPLRGGREAGNASGEAAARVQADRAVSGLLAAAAPIVAMPSMQQLLRHAPERQPQHTDLSIQAQWLQQLNAPPGLAPLPLQTCLHVHVDSTPFMGNTTRLLDDNLTEAWQSPEHPGAYDCGLPSVASNRLLVPGNHRPLGGPGAGPNMATVSESNGGNPTTVQLLAETSNQRATYERIVQNLAGTQDPLIAVPTTRADGPVAAGEQCSNGTNCTRNVSLELRVGDSVDLLEDGGLSLDNFQVPPEPNTALSQLQAEAEQQRQQGGLPHTRGGAAQLTALPATKSASLPMLTCQEFLRLIDINFINKICRETLVPGFDQPPTTVLEIYEATACTIPYLGAYHARSMDCAARLASIATSMEQLQKDLTENKQELFMEVQALPNAELDIVKDKFASLKELCRMRTVKQIKESQVACMEDYFVQLTARKMQLQEDLEAAKAEVERLRTCVEDANAVPALIMRMHQEEEERMQEALQGKRTLESHLQRLKVFRAKNKERQLQLDAAPAEQEAKARSKPSLSSLMDEYRQLEERAKELRSCISANVITPGREGQLTRQATKKLKTIEALLGLHGLQLDLTMMEHTGTFKLLFRKAYSIVATAANDFIDIRVACEDATAAGFNGLAPSLQDCIRASSSQLSCTIPRAQLPFRLELILEQLQRLCRIAQQLESSWLQFDCMHGPYASVLQQDAGSNEHSLVLEFINADTVTGVTICMPWSEALHSDFIKPQLRVQLKNLDLPETQQHYCDVLLDTVLSKLVPSRDYITAVCYAMNETLHVSDENA